MATTASPQVASGPHRSQALHPDLQPLAAHLLASARLALDKAVAHSADPARYPISPGSLEAVALGRFETRPTGARQRAIADAGNSLKADSPVRRQLKTVDLSSATPVLVQAEAQAPRLVIRDPGLLGLDLDRDGGKVVAKKKEPVKPKPKLQFDVFDTLELRLRKVRAADETDGFLGSESGDDEIGLGVIRIEPDGQQANLGTFVVGEEFDDGESVTYATPRVLARWDLKGDRIAMKGDQPLLVGGKQVPVGWPRTYSGILLLSELDNGGFPQSLVMVCDVLREWLVQKVTVAVAGAVGAWFGGPLGGAVGAAIGKVVGELVAYVFNGIIGFLVAIWNDDAFPPVAAKLTLKNPILDFKGKALGPATSTQEGMYWVKAHGGKYEMYFDWHLVK